jgi:hypothetical protein
MVVSRGSKGMDTGSRTDYCLVDDKYLPNHAGLSKGSLTLSQQLRRGGDHRYLSPTRSWLPLVTLSGLKTSRLWK